jgi:hypothetical protein
MGPPPMRRVHHRVRRGAEVTAAIHHSFRNMNRMSRYLEESPDEGYGDFFVVAGEFGVAQVTSDTAARIESVLDRTVVPAWIVFDDRVGSRFRVRTNHIRTIVECTAEQRAADRRIDRARAREEKGDRSWEEND